MPFLITLLYILTAYLSPATVFGSLAQYHVEAIIAVLAVVVSLPSLPNSAIFKTPQSAALLGLSAAVAISVMANGWLGGAIPALEDFLPSALAYFLVLLHCKTKRHVQALTVLLLFICLFVIARGFIDLRLGNYESSYLMSQKDDMETAILRIRGMSFLNDPNDLAQLLVSVIPLLFVFWAERRFLRNATLVLVPSCLLIFGMYLSHSRGGVIALIAVLLVAGRKRLGTLRSAIFAGIAFASTLALNWSGGREISVEAGSGRMEAWATGLQLVRSHPIFGVGYRAFTDYSDITAHNSIVVCAAELGMIGLFFWVLFLIPTVRDVALVSSLPLPAEGEAESSETPDRGVTSAFTTRELKRFSRMIMLCLTGLMVAGWFLSRAYVMTLFVYAALTEVLFQIALDRGIVKERLSLRKLVPVTCVTSVSLLFLVYIMLRISNLLH